VDRHIHLYGALSPGQALDLAEGHAVDWGWLAGRWVEAGLTAPDFAALARRRHAGEAAVEHELAALFAGGPPGFSAFQARYDLVVACSRWASGRHDRWEAANASEIDRVCSIVGAQGPAEVRLLLPGTATPAWAEAALEHAAAAAARAGLQLAISLPRAEPLRHWPIVAQTASRHPGITGIDLCGLEDEPARHAPLAAAIAAWNQQHYPRRLQFLVHVGEQLRGVQPLTALRRVWDAVAIGADRLGHALAARLDPAAWPATPVWERVDERRARLTWLQWQADRLDLDADSIDHEIAALTNADPAHQLAADPLDAGLLLDCQQVVLERLSKARRTVEVCPSSNRMISGAEIAQHGIDRLNAAGVAWVVGSDDPGILGTSFAEECRLAGLC